MESGFSMPRKIPEEHKKRITESLQPVSTCSLITLLDVFNQFKMDIAVTGDSGSGKSTLINALCCLDNDDKDAAPTGVVETTMQPAMYPYPKNPHIRLWDLPGMGTPTFVSKSYVETMNFTLYDMFIVVTSERFRENNLLVISEIQKQKKPFYVVRTKIDNDLVSQSKKHNFSETAALSLMKDECLKYLHEKDLHPHVFLVSSHETERLDFRNLKDTLENEAPKLKREVFPIFLDNLFNAARRKAAAIKHHVARSEKIKDKDFQKLQKMCTHFSDGTEKVNATLEAFSHFQLDVAVLGEKKSGVTTLVNALSGQKSGTISLTDVEIPAMSPEYPDVRFWDVPGIETLMNNNSSEEMKLILDNFDFYIIIVSDWQRNLHIELARAINDLRKHNHFVQTKIDCHLQAQGDLCCSETEVLDGLRAQCAEELHKANADQSQLFLINSLDRNAFDFFSLENILRSDLNTVRASAFAYYVARVAKQKQDPKTCQIV